MIDDEGDDPIRRAASLQEVSNLIIQVLWFGLRGLRTDDDQVLRGLNLRPQAFVQIARGQVYLLKEYQDQPLVHIRERLAGSARQPIVLKLPL